MTEHKTTQQNSAGTLRADQRLVGLHRERGDAQHRLEYALASLEHADWGISLAGEAALAQQLRAMLGAGVLRLDGRLPLRRDLLAEAGLAAAGLDGDWRGAVGVWLLEPDADAMRRARDAGVPVIVDATLAPGSGWLTGQGGQAEAADYVVYHHGAALTGFAEVGLALLLGRGERPGAEAPAPTDLATAQALRDVATLPLRLARAAGTAQHLLEQLGGRALGVGPTALLLPPESAQATVAPLGGVLPAVRPVAGGLLLTPGLLDARAVLAATGLTASGPGQAETATAARESIAPSSERPNSERPNSERPNSERPNSERPNSERHSPKQYRPDIPAAATQVPGPHEVPQPTPQTTDEAGLERFVFEADAQEGHSSNSDGPQPEESVKRRGRHDRSKRDRDQQPREERSNGRSKDGRDGKGGRNERRSKADQRGGGSQRGAGKQRGEGKQRRHGAATPPVDLSGLAPDLPSTAPKEGKPDPAAGLTDEQAEVFERLREWRNEEAAGQSISRFIIASNATLAAIARQVPYTMAELADVKGMGPARLDKYGEAILRVVRGR